jgi:N-acetylneuraminate synthase
MSVHIIAEIGVNHNANLALAKRMITEAQRAGADSVKFQKRLPRISVPKSEWDKPKVTPWGTTMPYIEYKEKMEFDRLEYDELWAHAKSLGIPMFWSVWDIPSLEFVKQYDVPFVKVPSAKITDMGLLEAVADCGTPAIISTGMSAFSEVEDAVSVLERGGFPVVMHSVSSYPAPVEELNLRVITDLLNTYSGYDIGWSGHEVGLATTVAAVALGATYIERHFTLDRSMPGTDQSASVEPAGFRRLVHDIRNVEKALGDGVKRVMPSEKEAIARLRGVTVAS